MLSKETQYHALTYPTLMIKEITLKLIVRNALEESLWKLNFFDM